MSRGTGQHSRHTASSRGYPVIHSVEQRVVQRGSQEEASPSLRERSHPNNVKANWSALIENGLLHHPSQDGEDGLKRRHSSTTTVSEIEQTKASSEDSAKASYPLPVQSSPEASSTIGLHIISSKHGTDFQMHVGIGTCMGHVVQMVLNRVRYSGSDGYLFDPAARKAYRPGDQTLLRQPNFVNGSILYIISPMMGSYSGRVGLTNLGNTCYMNASLQCLLHTPELMDYFLKKKYEKDLRPENPDGCRGQMAEQFSKLMTSAWQVSSGTTETNYPMDLFRIVSEFYSTFTINAQHDIYKFTESLLDGLIEDTNQTSFPKPYRSTMDTSQLPVAQMADDHWNDNLSRSMSYVARCFYGQYYVSMHCPSCKHVDQSFEMFDVMRLGLPSYRSINLTCIDLRRGTLPEKLTANVSLYALIEDLYVEIASDLGIDEAYPWTVMSLVLDRKSFKFLHTKDSISSIQHDDEVLCYVYGSSSYRPSNGGRCVCFLHHQRIQTDGRSRGRNREETKRFGPPLFLWIPEDFVSDGITNCLKRTLSEVVAPLRRTNVSNETAGYEDSMDWFTLKLSSHSKALNMTTVDIDWHPSAGNEYDLHRLEDISWRSESFSPSVQRSELTTIEHCIQYELEARAHTLCGFDLWFCPKCRSRVNAAKIKKLWRMPDVLIVSFKRFGESEEVSELSKMDRFIQFPLNGLNLTDFHAEDAPLKAAVYDLYGVCYHHGEAINAERCTSRVKSPGGQWHEFADQHVRPVNEHEIVNNNAYLLFYRRRRADCLLEHDIVEDFRRLPEVEAVVDYRSRLGDPTVRVADLYAPEEDPDQLYTIAPSTFTNMELSDAEKSRTPTAAATPRQKFKPSTGTFPTKRRRRAECMQQERGVRGGLDDGKDGEKEHKARNGCYKDCSLTLEYVFVRSNHPLY